jgi:uncharacterized membrane protein
MISPFPEGSLILAFVLGFFGYQFTGNLTITIAISITTFLSTLILTWKFHLLQKFWKLFKQTWEGA